jgi:hypothetical protein
MLLNTVVLLVGSDLPEEEARHESIIVRAQNALLDLEQAL